MKNDEARPISIVSFPEVNVATYDHYVQTCGCSINPNQSGNYKNTFFHQKWKNIGKKKKVGRVAIFAIVVEAKFVEVVPFVRQNILLISINNHLKIKIKGLRQIYLMKMTVIWMLIT